MENSKRATQRLAETYDDRGDPNGWFEEFYAQADGDIRGSGRSLVYKFIAEVQD